MPDNDELPPVDRAAFGPGTGHALVAGRASGIAAEYSRQIAATKTFDLVLAKGLWYELRDRGADVVRYFRVDPNPRMAVHPTGER